MLNLVVQMGTEVDGQQQRLTDAHNDELNHDSHSDHLTLLLVLTPGCTGSKATILPAAFIGILLDSLPTPAFLRCMPRQNVPVL